MHTTIKRPSFALRWTTNLVPGRNLQECRWFSQRQPTKSLLWLSSKTRPPATFLTRSAVPNTPLCSLWAPTIMSFNTTLDQPGRPSLAGITCRFKPHRPWPSSWVAHSSFQPTMKATWTSEFVLMVMQPALSTRNSQSTTWMTVILTFSRLWLTLLMSQG